MRAMTIAVVGLAILACGGAPAPTLPVALTADPPGSQADADADAATLVARMVALGGSASIEAASRGRLALRTGGARPIADVLAPGALSFHVIDEPVASSDPMVAMMTAQLRGPPPSRAEAIAAAADVPAGRIGAVLCHEPDRCEVLALHRAFLGPGHVTGAAAKRGGDFEPPSVALTLDDAGRAAFAAATTANVGRRIAIVLDGTVWSAPRVMAPIPGGQVSLTADHDGFRDAEQLAAVLAAGPLRRMWSLASVGP